MAFGLLFGLVSTIVPIALIVGIIAAAVVIARREPDDDSPEPGIGTVRRVFLYGVGLVALIFAVSGLALLLGGLFDAIGGDTVIAESDTELAIALAFTIVGAPAWLIAALVAQRTVQTHPVEQRSEARRLYLALARGIALLIVLFNAVEVGRFLVGVADFDGGPWGWLLAWLAAWLLHDRLAAGEPPPTVATRLLERLYRYFGAVVGLYVLIGGAIGALVVPLSAAYDRAFRSTLVSDAWTDDLRTALVVVVIGAVVWSWHWLVTLARRDADSTLWRVYVFLAGILAGIALAIVPAALVLYAALEWFVGVPASDTAARHFDLLPASIGVFVVGVATWGYHRAVLHEADAAGRDQAAGRGASETGRVYRYIVAASGLATAATGLATLLAISVEVLTPDAAAVVRDEGWWRNQLVAAVTLLAVGAPLCLRYWRHIQQAVAASGIVGGVEERVSPSRRVFLFGVFGVTALLVLVNLIILLYRFFEVMLEGDVTAAVIDDTRWSIALLLTAGAIAVYHWLVLREDQRAPGAEAEGAVPPRRRDVVVLAGGSADAIVRALEQVEGVRVRVWRRLDTTDADERQPSDSELGTLHEQIAVAESDRLVVINGPGGLDLVPYDVGGEPS